MSSFFSSDIRTNHQHFASPHWSLQDMLAAHAAESFAGLAKIASRVISRIGQPVRMISGPISTGGKGDLAQNLAAFARAITFVHLSGQKIFSQMPTERTIVRLVNKWRQAGGVGYCMPILEDFYLPILSSGLVEKMIFMPDWRSSFGSNWEHDRCVELNIGIEYLPLDWDTDVS